jgi:hypothetical protein
MANTMVQDWPQRIACLPSPEEYTIIHMNLNSYEQGQA